MLRYGSLLCVTEGSHRILSGKHDGRHFGESGCSVAFSMYGSRALHPILVSFIDTAQLYKKSPTVTIREFRKILNLVNKTCTAVEIQADWCSRKFIALRRRIKDVTCPENFTGRTTDISLDIPKFI